VQDHSTVPRQRAGEKEVQHHSRVERPPKTRKKTHASMVREKLVDQPENTILEEEEEEEQEQEQEEETDR